MITFIMSTDGLGDVLCIALQQSMPGGVSQMHHDHSIKNTMALIASATPAVEHALTVECGAGRVAAAGGGSVRPWSTGNFVLFVLHGLATEEVSQAL